MHDVTKACMSERSIQLQDRPMDFSITKCSLMWFQILYHNKPLGNYPSEIWYGIKDEFLQLSGKGY